MSELSYLNYILDNNPHIYKLRVFSFSFLNKFQDRFESLTEKERIAIEDCMFFKQIYGVSFWEAVIMNVQLGEDIPERMFNHCLFHNKNNQYHEYLRDDFTSFIKGDIEGDIALNSEVILFDGSKKHIPMLDFKLKHSDSSLLIINRCLSALKLNGLILNSGKSYHFIGLDLVNENQLIDILARFTLMHPIADKAWAAHQIIERSASLRISKKHGHIPLLIDTHFE